MQPGIGVEGSKWGEREIFFIGKTLRAATFMVQHSTHTLSLEARIQRINSRTKINYKSKQNMAQY